MTHCRRRTMLQAGLALAAMPVPAWAQPSSAKRLGWLSAGWPGDPGFKATIETVIEAMRGKGWVRDANYLVEFRFVEGDASRYPAMADELIAWGPDVLYGLETAAKVLVTKTRTIPIVLATSIDPVAAGLVHSLARPGTNVTGMMGQTDQLVVKQVELLVELVPRTRHIALLIDPNWAGLERSRQFARQAASAKGLALTIVPVSDDAGVRAAFAQFERQRIDAVIVGSSPGAIRLAAEIQRGALRLRLPVAGHVQSGAVLEYSQDFVDQWRQSADFIDQIFRGANPAELPVRQALRYVVSVNLQAARHIGLTVPQSILLRADRVIE
jgi:putative ABC transport system substrate-binding protein